MNWYTLDKKHNVIPYKGLMVAKNGQLLSRPFPSDEEFKRNQRVAETTLPDGKCVSTVFLGWDHGFGSGPPIVFETMVFPSKEDFSDIDSERYSTWKQAVAGHKKMVKKWSENESKPK